MDGRTIVNGGAGVESTLSVGAWCQGERDTPHWNGVQRVLAAVQEWT